MFKPLKDILKLFGHIFKYLKTINGQTACHIKIAYTQKSQVDKKW